METIEGKQENPRKIQKLEIVMRGQGGPAETLAIKVNGREDSGFLLGVSNLFEVVSKEEFAEFFPNVFEMTEKDGRKIFKLKGKPKDILLNEEGLQMLANKLGITLEILQQSTAPREIRKGYFERRSIEPEQESTE